MPSVKTPTNVRVPRSVTAACGRLLELETSIFTRAKSDLRTCADLNMRDFETKT